MTSRLKIWAPNGASSGTAMFSPATENAMPLCGVA